MDRSNPIKRGSRQRANPGEESTKEGTPEEDRHSAQHWKFQYHRLPIYPPTDHEEKTSPLAPPHPPKVGEDRNQLCFCNESLASQASKEAAKEAQRAIPNPIRQAPEVKGPQFDRTMEDRERERLLVTSDCRVCCLQDTMPVWLQFFVLTTRKGACLRLDERLAQIKRNMRAGANPAQHTGAAEESYRSDEGCGRKAVAERYEGGEDVKRPGSAMRAETQLSCTPSWFNFAASRRLEGHTGQAYQEEAWGRAI
ncbi:hypothetical protein BC827DRAFT_1157803 [Russula dissimulans]|nr:hypothetical protein BC827DRAFT_1157803 [Russula dissimulans]